MSVSSKLTKAKWITQNHAALMQMGVWNEEVIQAYFPVNPYERTFTPVT